MAAGTIAALAVLTACGGAAPREPRARPRGPATVLLEWKLHNRAYGDEELTVMSNGRARYLYTPNVPTRPGERGEATLTTTRFREARLALERAHACALRSEREGEPYEPQGTLRLALPNLQCSVTLWDGEWRIDDDARDVLQVIEELRDWLRGTR